MTLREDHLLSGVTVADLTVTGPGPFCTLLLCRMGARVIHFEPPRGDTTRIRQEVYDALNGGKESVVVDLNLPEDRAFVLRVAARADVLCEGWRPGVAERLGVDYKTVSAANRAIVYCSLSGYGRSGPLRDRPAHDVNFLAESGMLSAIFGEETPRAPAVPIGDFAGGTGAALRVVAGLFAALATGEGLHIDASVTGAVRDWADVVGAMPGGVNALGSILPAYGVFETADGGYLSLGTVNEDHFWDALADIAERPDWRGLDFAERAMRVQELRAELATAVKERSVAEWERALADVNTCWAIVRQPSEHPPIGGRLPAVDAPAPALGAHDQAVRSEFAP